MESRGELHRRDPVARFLPPTVNMPARGGRQITLEHLASHRSGLPQLPADLTLADLSNRYATYSLDQLYAFLSGHQLRRDIGGRYRYSNVAASLLGHALELVADSHFDALVRDRIAAPLRMSSTGIALPPHVASRLAQGHNVHFAATPRWHLPILNPAVGLHSTANDLLRLLALHLGHAGLAEHHNHLEQAAESLLDHRWEAARGSDIAMGWHIVARDSDEIVAHDGGTNGFRSFVGFRPGIGIGVVVLSNYAIAAGVNDIGMHLLDATHPLLPPDSPLLR